MSHDSQSGSRLRPYTTAIAVVLVTGLALGLRLVGLGVRTMHWDEGRVAYWILRYHENGHYFYRPIIHGPFLAIVNNYVFSALPPTDFSARLPVAVVGGLLPLSAYLLRDRLRDSEVVAVALFLAVNPIFVYYSRFMRNDMLVAAFSFWTLAFFVCGVDRRDPKYLYPAAISLALAFTAKENALLYVACFVGGGVLLFDHHLLRRTTAGESLRDVLRGDYVRSKQGLSSWAGDSGTATFVLFVHTVGALVAFFAVVVFFYAPRPQFWHSFGSFGAFAHIVDVSTVGAWDRFAGQWGQGHGHRYLSYVADLVQTLLYGAAVTIVFAVVGFVADGYSDGTARDIVAFSGYWAVASMIGYPVVTDIKAPWAAVHVVIALAIPAGVGGGYVYRVARRSIAVEDALATGMVGLVLLSAIVGVAGANATYMNAASVDQKEILQWAQPSNHLKDTLREVKRVSRANQGTDVLFYGTCNPAGDACDLSDPSDALFYVKDESSLDRMPPGGPAWHSRLPLPWYLERYGANVTSSAPNKVPQQVLEPNPPPVVIVYSWNASDVEPYLSGYERHEERFKLWSEKIVIYIDPSVLHGNDADRSPGTNQSANATEPTDVNRSTNATASADANRSNSSDIEGAGPYTLDFSAVGVHDLLGVDPSFGDPRLCISGRHRW